MKKNCLHNGGFELVMNGGDEMKFKCLKCGEILPARTVTRR